jgi:hypothetical protein
MLEFLFNNLATIIICLGLAGIVTAIIIKLIKDRKNGKSSYCCNCGSCPMNKECHK